MRAGPQIGEATRSSAPAVGWSTVTVAGRPASAAAASASGTVRTLPTGTPAASSASIQCSAGCSRSRCASSGISSSRLLDALGVGGKALVGSSSSASTPHSALNSPSLAAAIASRPDAVSKVS